jgi:O-antigen/teichoic acid export membrane protein
MQRIAKNSFFIFAGEIIVRIITFFTTLVLIRYLGSGEFGKYSLVFAFLSFFEFFRGMAVDPIIIRELSKDEKRGAYLIGSAITLKFFFSLIGIVLCWIILQLMHYPPDIKMFIYIASLTIIFSFGTLFNNIFQAKLLMKYIIAVTVFIKILLAIFTVALVFLKAKLFYFIALNLLLYIIQIILVFYKSKRFLPVKVLVDLAAWKELLKNSWPISVSIIFVSIYGKIDHVMLFKMRGSYDLGFYAAAIKLTELLVAIAAILMTSIFPLLSEYARTSPDAFKKTYELAFKYLMLFIIPIAVMVTLYSRQIILLCYGRNFLASASPLSILIWSTVFIYIGIVHSNLLVAVNLQHLDVIFTSSFLVINVLLNLFLIPRYSFVGAAIAMAVSYAAIIVPISYALRRTRRFARAIISSMIKPSLAAFSAGYLVYFFSRLNRVYLFASNIIYKRNKFTGYQIRQKNLCQICAS